MEMDQIWLIIGVIVVVLILRLIAVRRVGRPSGPAQGFSQKPSLGSRLTKNDAQLIQQVQQLLQGGRFIEAVKIVKESKRIGLKEAKEFVEAIQKNPTRNISTQGSVSGAAKEKALNSSSEIETRARHLAQGGHVIEAIKYVREQSGMDLKSAKEYVETLLKA